MYGCKDVIHTSYFRARLKILSSSEP